jgi:hypothetical protein
MNVRNIFSLTVFALAALGAATSAVALSLGHTVEWKLRMNCLRVTFQERVCF